MKICLFILFVFTFQMMAINGKAQDAVIELKSNKVTINQLINEIEKQTDYLVVFSNSEVNTSRTVYLKNRSDKVSELLNQTFNGTDIGYDYEENYIVLSKKANEAINILSNMTTALQQQGKTLRGHITDLNGESVIGASIVLKNNPSQGTITDIDGNFILTNLKDGEVIQITYVGMVSQEIAVGNQSFIEIVLSEDAIGLEEVVAIGYGTVRKGDLTGSVSTVSTKNFEKLPASNALQLLQGRATGLQVTTESGMPGAGANVLIRGVQSIQGTNSPVYVVDGMITSNISSLNPNSIESVSVLKDASASAIYGARAANGVILITTKRGSRQKDMQISLNSYYGFQTESNLKLKLLNASQFIELFTETYENAGMDLTWNPADLNQYAGVDTNWKDLMLQTGITQNYDLSISGGSDKSNYFISAAYLNQKGMVIETGYKKYTFNLNTDHTVADWIKFGNSLSIFSTSRDGSADYYASALRQSPLRRAYEEDGDYGIVRNSNLEHIQRNPIWQAKETVNNNEDKGLQGNLYLTLDLFKGLQFTTRGSMDYSTRYTTIFTPGVSSYYGWEGSPINSVTKGHYETMHWITDFLLNYDRTFANDHNVKALLGYSLEESVYEDLTGTRPGTPTNEIRFLNAGDPDNQTNTNNYSDWAFTSLFGRLNYAYKQKYLFTATVRRDGTSRLSQGTKYGIFPSASVAWRVSEEGFLKDKTAINDLKLRASYGSLGNVLSVGTYATVPSLTSVNAVYNNALAKGYTLTSAINKDLKWESANKFNVGADITLLDNKLYSSVDYFIEDTYNLLFNEPIAYSTGLSGTPLINAGQIRNKGFEIEVGHRGHKSDWTYDVSLNLSHVKNAVIDLEGRDLRTSGIEEGFPVRSYFGYKTNGLIKDASELQKYKDGTFKTKDIGDIAILDIDGYDADGNLTGAPDGKINAADRTIIGNRYPDFIYGAVGFLSYKNWSLQMQLQGVQGVDLNIRPYGDYSMLSLMTSWARNEDARVLDRFHPTKNPDGKLPRITKSDKGQNKEPSDFWLVDGSYMRVRNVNLSYNLPRSVCNSLMLRDLSLYTSVQNLYTFTKYDGPDVDTAQEPTGVPQPRVWTFGFVATF